MYKSLSTSIVIFISICTLLICVLIFFTSLIIFEYKKRQISYYKSLEEIKANHEKIMLYSQTEIQEQTFQNISREIHDNIGQKLSLSKLYLNLLEYQKPDNLKLKISKTIELISEAILELSTLSRCISSEVVLSGGLVQGIDHELIRIRQLEIYEVSFLMTGNSTFLEPSNELCLFRIFQESMNNIIKHSKAQRIDVVLNFNDEKLGLSIKDNGIGFNLPTNNFGTGISNMKKRVEILRGKMSISSATGEGTEINIDIPLILKDQTN